MKPTDNPRYKAIQERLRKPKECSCEKPFPSRGKNQGKCGKCKKKLRDE